MNWKIEACLSRSNTGSLWGRVDLIITFLLILGLMLNAWGIVSNGVTVIANDYTMPVVFDTPIILDNNPGTPRVLTDKGNLLLLADRIAINFPDIRTSLPKGRLGVAVRWWGKWLNYPFEGGGNMVSVGDLMRWGGTVLFLCLLPFLIVAIMRRICAGDTPRIFTQFQKPRT